MYYKATLVLSSYKPLRIEAGMWFINRGGELFQLSSPVRDIDTYVKENGWPVEPYILDEGHILALPDEIGWVEEDEYLREISIEDVKCIMNDYDGEVYIQIEDESEDVVPLHDENKVIINYGKSNESAS